MTSTTSDYHKQEANAAAAAIGIEILKKHPNDETATVMLSAYKCLKFMADLFILYQWRHQTEDIDEDGADIVNDLTAFFREELSWLTDEDEDKDKDKDDEEEDED